MKRIIVTEGDGQSVRRVAKKYTAQVRIYAETDYNNRPALVLVVRPGGEWELVQNGATVAEGSIDPAYDEHGLRRIDAPLGEL